MTRTMRFVCGDVWTCLTRNSNDYKSAMSMKTPLRYTEKDRCAFIKQNDHASSRPRRLLPWANLLRIRPRE